MPQAEGRSRPWRDHRHVAEGVTIETPVEVGPRWRPTDTDEQIRAFCAGLPQFVGAPATLVTGDTTMRLRAAAQGTRVVGLPEKNRRGSTAPPTTDGPKAKP
jgi:hypothetical protein